MMHLTKPQPTFSGYFVFRKPTDNKEKQVFEESLQDQVSLAEELAQRVGKQEPAPPMSVFSTVRSEAPAVTAPPAVQPEAKVTVGQFQTHVNKVVVNTPDAFDRLFYPLGKLPGVLMYYQMDRPKDDLERRKAETQVLKFFDRMG